MADKVGYARSIGYFWKEKGDIERFTSFDRKYLAREFPEVLKAWDDYKASRRVLDAVVRDVLARAEAEEDARLTVLNGGTAV